jgi:small GTP-binding protein
MEEDFAMYKIVIIGSSGTGKTNMCSRYINDKYIESQTSTVGVEFLTKTVQLREKQVKVSFWDTAGQERYKSMNKLYYKGANGVLVVYDITDPQSYINIESWIRYASTSF